MSPNSSVSEALSVVFLVMVSTLQLILPIPHTIALRNALLLVFVVAGLRALIHPSVIRGLLVPVLPWGLLTVWLIMQTFMLQGGSSTILRELAGQFLLPLLVIVAAVGAGLRLVVQPRLEFGLFVVLILPLVLHVLYGDIVFAGNLFLHGAAGREPGLTEGPDKFSYLVVTGIVLLLGWKYQQVNLPDASRWMHVTWWICLLVFMVGILAAGMRLGFVSLMIVLLTFGILLLFYAPSWSLKRKLIVAASFMLVGTLFMGWSLYKDSRWSTLRDTISVVSSTHDSNHYWLDQKGEPPRLPSGESVGLSNYYRLSWWYEALGMIRQWPLGIGYSRNAFGHGLKMKYGTGKGHSHSGWLDLALGGGLPVLVLWVLGLVVLFFWAWRHLHLAPLPSVALMLLVLDFGFRSMFDSVIRDHMLVQFMLTSGVLIGWIVARAAAPVQKVPPPR